MLAPARPGDGTTIHTTWSASPEQRLAAAVLNQAVEDAIMRASPLKREAAYRWLMTPAALWWIALITPDDQTPEDVRRQAVLTVKQGRRESASVPA